MFRALARQIQKALLRTQKQKIFLLYIEKKAHSALGQARSKGGFSAPERRKFSFSIIDPFRAWARQIQRSILCVRTQKIFFLYIEKARSALGHARSKEGYSMLECRKCSFSIQRSRPVPRLDARSKGGFSAPESRKFFYL